jgi:Flp pilus assembly protein TadG
MVLTMPALFVLLALVYAYGRVAQVNGALDAGVRDAARVATQARSAGTAHQAAEAAIRDSLGEGATSCQDSLRVEEIPAVGFEPGVPVTVRASCTIPMRDLWLPGMTGEITASSAFTSQLDPNRGVWEQ